MFKSLHSSFVLVPWTVILVVCSNAPSSVSVGNDGSVGDLLLLKASQQPDVDASEGHEACEGLSFVQRSHSFHASDKSLQAVIKNTTFDVLPHSASMHPAFAHFSTWTHHLNSKKDMHRYGFAAAVFIALITIVGLLLQSSSARMVEAVMAICVGGLYIFVSALMIETNKWLMHEDHFPYPVMLTMNHMLASCILCNALRVVHPSSFPALQRIAITPAFCLKFLGIGVPFAVSLMCGNWAYKYLTVSFLQIMKQSNIVTIYVLSVLAGLEALRRCSVVLLAGVLTGAMMAIQGELNFVMTGFLLQACSSISEAAKVIIQSLLMSGEMKLDPLTMVLFMAPACFLANLVPLAAIEGSHMASMFSQFLVVWPVILGNACLAFVLNVTVAQCIKQLSAVGYLLCGIVKDICIIVTSAWFLGESLAPLQTIGFSIALTFVALFALYKQNIGMFDEDNLLQGFTKMILSQSGKEVGKSQDRCNQTQQDNVSNSDTPVIKSNREK